AQGAYSRCEPAAARHDVGDHLRHSHQAVILQTFGSADQKHFRREIFAQLLKNGPAMVGWHHADHDVGPGQGFTQVIRGSNSGRNLAAGKELGVLALGRDGLTHLVFVSPEPDLVSVLSGKSDGKCRSPCSGAYHRHLAHPRLAPPRRCSVPAISRRMFPWCLIIMSAEAAAMQASTIGELRYPSKSHARSGSRATAMIDPSDT